jgi:pilus assembly protein CpaF
VPKDVLALLAGAVRARQSILISGPTGAGKTTFLNALSTFFDGRDRVVVIEELRGEEAFEYLQSLNTGHRGALSTTHANSARESLERFAICVLMSNIALSHDAIARQIALGLQLLVHLDVYQAKPTVTEVVRMRGYDAAAGVYLTETVYAA